VENKGMLRLIAPTDAQHVIAIVVMERNVK